MFYESWGLLLERADQVLRLQVRDHVADGPALAALDAVATLVGELGAMWPGLFAGIEEETRAMERAFGQPPVSSPEPRDPLQAHRDAVLALNDDVDSPRRSSGEARAELAQARRKAILSAAAVEAELVERVATRASGQPGRRI